MSDYGIFNLTLHNTLLYYAGNKSMNRFLQMTESQNAEYKESWRDEYLKWVCGFANAHGGTIYIGVDDKGHAGS